MVVTVTFQLAGQGFMAIHGGPQFTSSPAISFLVDCADQAEVDAPSLRLGPTASDNGHRSHGVLY
jgi:predicted 3-demethylubiquinone-9 3-methyltransferase (glyoxalase superfamily)